MIAATPKEAIKIRRFIFASRFRTSAALSRHSPDARVEKGHGLPVDALWQRVSSAIGRCRQPSDVVPSGGVEGGDGFHQDAAFPLSSITFDPCAAHAGAGGGRSRAIRDRMSANNCRDTATSANWNVT